MPKHTATELNEMFNKAEQADYELFCEQRSNVRLYAGYHYRQKRDHVRRLLQKDSKLDGDAKIRLTENHLNKIVNYHVGVVHSLIGSVSPTAKNPEEFADQKSAELCSSVWQDMKQRHKLKNFKRLLNKDYHLFGEAACLVKWRQEGGEYLGSEQFSTDGGEIKSLPVYTGDVSFERVLPFDLLRDPAAKSVEDIKWFVVRKLRDKDEMMKLYEGQPEKQSYIESQTGCNTYEVFNAISGDYEERDNLVLVMEWYFKPCPLYPEGYYYIATKEGILHQGPLPLGGRDFPVKFCGYDEIPTTPRYASLLRPLRPVQKEVNRCLSMIAQSQLTFGPRAYIQRGTSLTAAKTAGGHKSIMYSGMAPQIEQGQSGIEYIQSLDRSVRTIYQLGNVEEAILEKQPSQVDTYAELMRHIKDKQKFSYHAEALEDMFKEIVETALEVARNYYPDDMLVPAVGRSEYINLDEFRDTTPLYYKVTPDMQSDNAEEKIGKMIAYEKTLQYAGDKLSREDVGSMIVNLPYGNKEQVTSDVTVGYRNMQNMILALDRGGTVQVSEFDDPDYILARLVARMREPSFNTLHQQILENYRTVYESYKQIKEEQMRQVQEMNAGFIPTGGRWVKLDVYEPNEEGKAKRMMLPEETINWLTERLTTQGAAFETIETQPGLVNDIAASYQQPELQAVQPDPYMQ